jgi:hypothetical protein
MSARREQGESLPGRVTLNGQAIDRRAFLGALALTAAGSAVPFARGAPGGAAWGAAAATAVAEGSWHVDDMWGHWPRYAHPISYTLVRHVPIDLDTVAPADRQFMM